MRGVVKERHNYSAFVV